MKQGHLELNHPPLGPGLPGLVQGVAQLMAADVDELLGISSAAFCTYMFDPAVNTHEPEPREYSAYASLFSNYGPWESISYYTGWEILEVSALSAVETLKIVAFEINAGRPMVTLTPDLDPTLVTGYRIGVDERVVVTQAGEVVVRDDSRLQGDEQLFRNWLLLVRPGEQPEWAASQVRQQIDLLRWVVQHARNDQEFFQETSENYAPGLRGLRRFRAFLDGLTDPAGVAHAERTVRGLHLARAAAASCLSRWAEPIAESMASAEARAHIEDAAGHYRDVAQALGGSATFVDAMDVVLEAEERAIAALGQLSSE